MDRVILHSDMNNFYASVECLYDSSLRDKPIAVGGDPEQRHGIVLAKNYIAKAYGIQTGEALWQAKKKCPDIIFVPPHFERYLRFSQLARKIYYDFTDQIEPFGLDEVWLDVTGSKTLFGSGKKIADEIRERVKKELGITVSIGVSYNKIFAKLGSDMKKPDAITEIYPDNYSEKIWRLPVGKLLYVGPSTQKKLRYYGIYTIGDLANTDTKYLQSWFGINGIMLWQFANGLDNSPVSIIGAKSQVKSIGNSTTTPKDLTCDDDVKITLFLLSESVATRLRECGLLCHTVLIYVRDNKLQSFERQIKLEDPVCVSDIIADKAFYLFKTNMQQEYAVRSLGVRACDLTMDCNRQIGLLPESVRIMRQEDLENAVDNIRRRFGHYAIRRGIMLADKSLSTLNPKDDHIIHPVAFMR
ncbi:MAG: DNA polymerase IV [Clostridiales bacterium GWF2_36_10]|nr:MAG: DNA polymerase IV [Clostridiales bacterium GWF2_36_10]HAN21863.1 DNA polymerase IV [Clostridiales bacterium]